MTAEHDNPKVLDAAMWIAERHNNEGGRIVPAVRSRFSLTAVEACQACALADRFRQAGRTANA
ncbi:hypothetical protein [Shinella sp. DD12]|uniref:hypothetical protein n=1 Tax=Shinella sp. DD12 TaxID=1410620 RepID=UPI0003C56781|nr:hypothetical protein [Shinella sp. DD12]EYR84236.1 hypothetical protein SHLA_14c000180 [Shinella sp. DD12]